LGRISGQQCSEIILSHVKNLVLPFHLLPFTLAELNARLNDLIAFDTDIFVLGNNETIRLWKHGAGYDTTGLDYIIGLRGKHYVGSNKSER